MAGSRAIACFAAGATAGCHGHRAYACSSLSAARKPWKSAFDAACRYSVLAPAASPVSSLVRAAKYSQRESVRWASGMRRIAASVAPQSLRAIASRACHSCSEAS